MRNEDDHKYDDIINLPHHISNRHTPMPIADRAAQFAPFAALTGHSAVIRETARLTEEKRELNEDTRETLDRKLYVVKEHLKQGCVIKVTYFEPDMKKRGGKYIQAIGSVKKVDEYRKCIVMTDGTLILIDDILDISGDIFQNSF